HFFHPFPFYHTFFLNESLLLKSSIRCFCFRPAHSISDFTSILTKSSSLSTPIASGGIRGAKTTAVGWGNSHPHIRFRQRGPKNRTMLCWRLKFVFAQMVISLLPIQKTFSIPNSICTRALSSNTAIILPLSISNFSSVPKEMNAPAPEPPETFWKA
ncbi:MAG: hypothetical protein K2O18_11900, partial [Oscillospiraceae bacterium]|nr:hypothetical protein [Oscillospiraceae bacterium]